MSHHGMHIPPQMLPMLGGMKPFEKTEKTKKKQRLKQTASTEQLDELNEADETEESFKTARVTKRAYNPSNNPQTGGRPQQHQLSDKVVKSLLEVQEDTANTRL